MALQCKFQSQHFRMKKSWTQVFIKTTLTFLSQHWLLKVLFDLVCVCVCVSTDWQLEMKALSLALHLEPRRTGAAWLESDGWHSALLLSKQNKDEATRRQRKASPSEAERVPLLCFEY